MKNYELLGLYYYINLKSKGGTYNFSNLKGALCNCWKPQGRFLKLSLFIMQMETFIKIKKADSQAVTTTLCKYQRNRTKENKN